MLFLTKVNHTLVHLSFIQFPSERVEEIEVQRPVLVLCAFELSSEFGPTPHYRSPSLHGMRNINCKTLREDAKRIPTVSDVLDPLHLVVGIVDEPLIERRQEFRLLHHDVRLLRPSLETADRSE